MPLSVEPLVTNWLGCSVGSQTACPPAAATLHHQILNYKRAFRSLVGISHSIRIMHPTMLSTRTLEYGSPCASLSFILIIVYVLSFALTWYRVWWDSVIGVLVAVFGYSTLQPTDAQQLNLARVRYYYIASKLSMVSHVVATTVIAYYMMQGDILSDVKGSDAFEMAMFGGRVFLAFLLALLAIEITLASLLLSYCGKLLAEIDRNSVVAELIYDEKALFV